ncbi:MAG: PAS domain S-box protein [Anaerolineales bacterium]|nr:PAS domain S-box protein [Anaerolineales bacterium]
MPRQLQIISFAALVGLLFWILDAVQDHLFLSQDSFWRVLFFPTPRSQLLLRIGVVLLFLGFGLLISYLLTKSEKNRKRYQTLLHNLPQGSVLVFDAALRILLREGSGLEQADLPSDQLPGKTIPEAFPEKAAEKITSAALSALNGESSVIRVNLDPGVYTMSVLPIPDGDGETSTGMIIAQDITHKTEREKILMESERRFREILEKVEMIGVILDDNGKISFCNDFFLDLTGWSREEVLGVDWFATFLPREVQEEIKESMYLKALQGGTLETPYLNAIVTQRGEQRMIAWNNILLHNSQGKRIGTASLGVDITREEEYRQELENIFEMSPDMIAVADLNTSTFTKINPVFQEVLGYSPEELLSKPWLDFVHPEDKEPTIKIVEEQLKKGKDVLHFVNRYRTKSGGYRWLDWIARPDPEEGISYNIARDITEQRQRQEELVQHRQHLEKLVASRTEELEGQIEEVNSLNAQMAALTQDLQETNQGLAMANQELKSFVYSVSHDLRAPLRGISGFAHILADRHQDDLNEQGKQYLQYIVQASTRMSNLIDDLLRYSRLGKNAVHGQRVDCEQLLSHLLQDLVEDINESGAVITWDKETLPEIFTDRTLLKQIMLNLLDNALTYHQPGTPPRIQLSCQARESQLIIKVSDQGIGIPPEHQEKIFNIFQRLHSAEDYPGTGVGLALVQKAVKLLEGEVSVSSEPGVGSTFTVKIPLG